ncbi:hypothetical protein PSFL111601_11100 [Pseudomonas floridensis]
MFSDRLKVQAHQLDAVTSAHIPTLFHRHNRPLQALLLKHQPWFSARDLGRLIGWPLNVCDP